MENNKKNIDNLFKEQLGSYTEAPPPAAWDALEKKLNNKPPVRGNGPGYRKLGYMAILLLFISASIVIARKITNESNSQYAATDEKITAAVQQTVAAVPPPTVETQQAPEATAVIEPTAKPVVPASTPTTAKAHTPTAQNNTQSKETTNNTQSKNNRLYTNKIPAKINTSSVTSPRTPSALATNTVYQAQPATSGPAIPNQEPETAKETAAEKVVPNADNKTTTTPPEVKKDTVKKLEPAKVDLTIEPKKKQKTKPNFQRFEAGIKGGYERGFDNDAATKVLASPYLAYHLTPKVALMLQPAIKGAKVNTRRIGTAQDYYKVNNDAVTSFVDSTPVYIPMGVGRFDTFWLRNYAYSQTHDSIVKANSIGGTYIELELPVMLKYNLTKKLSVYGGVNMAYSKLTGVTEQTYTSDPILKTGNAITLAHVKQPAPAAPAVNTAITYAGTSYASYSGPQYPNPGGDLFRLGYMVGFSYEFRKQWLFDGLVQQGMVKSNNQAGVNVNAPLSAPYIRLTLGYKLTK